MAWRLRLGPMLVVALAGCGGSPNAKIATQASNEDAWCEDALSNPALPLVRTLERFNPLNRMPVDDAWNAAMKMMIHCDRDASYSRRSNIRLLGLRGTFVRMDPETNKPAYSWAWMFGNPAGGFKFGVQVVALGGQGYFFCNTYDCEIDARSSNTFLFQDVPAALWDPLVAANRIEKLAPNYGPIQELELSIRAPEGLGWRVSREDGRTEFYSPVSPALEGENNSDDQLAAEPPSDG